MPLGIALFKYVDLAADGKAASAFKHSYHCVAAGFVHGDCIVPAKCKQGHADQIVLNQRLAYYMNRLIIYLLALIKLDLLSMFLYHRDYTDLVHSHYSIYRLALRAKSMLIGFSCGIVFLFFFDFIFKFAAL